VEKSGQPQTDEICKNRTCGRTQIQSGKSETAADFIIEENTPAIITIRKAVAIVLFLRLDEPACYSLRLGVTPALIDSAGTFEKHRSLSAKTKFQKGGGVLRRHSEEAQMEE